MLHRFFIVCILLLAVNSLAAQRASKYLDIVKTHNGKTYEGQIIRYIHDEVLTIRFSDGEELTLGMEEVKRIGFARKGKEDSPKRASVKRKAATEIIEKKWASIPAIAVNFGSERLFDNPFGPDRQTIAGYTLAFTQAYHFNRHIMFGLGVDYTVFNSDRKERVGSVFATARGTFTKNKIAPYGQLQVGYGLPIGSKEVPLDSRSGGVILHPSLGIRFAPTPEQPEFNVDIGYRFLDTEYAFESFRGVETRTNQYRRLFIRMSTSF